MKNLAKLLFEISSLAFSKLANPFYIRSNLGRGFSISNSVTGLGNFCLF